MCGAGINTGNRAVFFSTALRRGRGIGLLGFVAAGLFLACAAQAATRTWDGGDDGHSWNVNANWDPDGHPGYYDTLTIATTGTIDNVYRDGGTATYNHGYTWRGNVNLDQGTILIDHQFESGDTVTFNIGDGIGTNDATVHVTTNGWWLIDRHGNGAFTINIKSDGQLNTSGNGNLRTFSGHNGRKWVINVQGGSLTSVAAWNMSDGAGNDANRLNLSNGGTVTAGAITVHEEVIDFTDTTLCTFTAAYGGSFADISAVQAAMGTRFVSSGGMNLAAVDNGGSFTIELAKIDNDTGATDLAIGSATLNGYLSRTNGPTYVWVFWGATDGGTNKPGTGPGAWSNTVDFVTPQAVGPLTTGVSGLAADTTYYYRYYASNATWEAWASGSASFATLTAFTWDGDTDDMWGNTANWAGSDVPDTAGEHAIFDGTGPGDVDINGTSYTIDFIDLTAGDYTLTNSGGAATLSVDALTNSGGANAISADLTVTGTTQVTGGTLALKNIDGYSTDDIALSGGTLQVWGSTLDIVTPNALEHRGFDHPGNVYDDQNDLDLSGNGGLMAMVPTGTALLTGGPGNRGLDFNSDNDFRNTGAIGQTDNYMNLFIGYFVPAESGVHGFRRAADDDRCGIWIDLNANGVFESTTPGLGSNRGEQLQWDGDGGNKAVTLVAGRPYMIAFTHLEGGGGSQVDMRFSTPSLSERVIKPSDPAQAGMWAVQASFPDMNNLASTPIIATGDATLDLLARSTLNNVVLSNGTLQVTGASPTITTTGAGNLTSFGTLLFDAPSTVGTLTAGKGGVLAGAEVTAATKFSLEPALIVSNVLTGTGYVHVGDSDSSDEPVALPATNHLRG